MRSVLASLIAAAILLLCNRAAPAAEPATAQKISLRVFYAGHPGAAREKDFVAFLGKHFTEVKTGDLAAYKDTSADGFDVAILDYDGKGFEAPQPSLSEKYARATVMVGVVGGLLAARRGLKTGYL